MPVLPGSPARRTVFHLRHHARDSGDRSAVARAARVVAAALMAARRLAISITVLCGEPMRCMGCPPPCRVTSWTTRLAWRTWLEITSVLRGFAC